MRVQQYKKYDKKAEISIFISLLCVSVCAFIYIVIESAKMNAVMLKMEALTDIAVRSCFAEYCKPLFDEYGLLYVDTAYKTSNGGSSSFLNHVASYISVNSYVEGTDFTNISFEDGILFDEVYASDNEYESLKKQIVSVMNRHGYVGDENELIYQFINYHFTDYFESISENEMEESYSTEDYINVAVELISENMRTSYSEHFDFNNLLESCETTVVLNANGKEYEKTIKYGLFVQ